MTPAQILEAMGVRIVVCSKTPTSNVVGNPPMDDAGLVRTEQGYAVWVRSLRDGHLIDAIHEALHALIGKTSFDCELSEGLMAAEWAFCHELSEPYFNRWRGVFSCYGFTTKNRSEIGNASAAELNAAPEWRKGVRAAIRHGVLHKDGRPVWGLGPHPSLDRIPPKR